MEEDREPGRSRMETALSLLHQKDIEILKGVLQVNSALLTGAPDLAALRRTLQRGDLIEDLTSEIEDLAVGLKDGRGRQLRRIAVAYRSLLFDLQMLLDGVIAKGNIPKKLYRQIADDCVELVGLIEESKSRFWDLLASTDELTGLLNRHALEESFEIAFERSAKSDGLVAVALIDADHFKALNDTHGHDFGDRALVAIADATLGAIRPGDAALRYGGEEILVFLPNVTARTARSIMDRVRQRIEAIRLHAEDGEEVQVTASAGFTLATREDELETAISKADEALYEAKDKGRNRVIYRARQS
ncbi:MAG TPA: hypothetical protein DCF73_18120 [Rhodobiaceae bacterium]|nr:hypothetical protein [Rhodobiaceae bacterium]